MAKDDYFVIVYRVLVYLYACLKRRIIFDEATFSAAVRRDAVAHDYFMDALRMMERQGLIRDLDYFTAWGEKRGLPADVPGPQITITGILYLQDGAKMAEAAAQPLDDGDLIGELAALL